MRETRHLPIKQLIHDYSLTNQVLESVQSAKYLGVTTSDSLDWGQYISDIIGLDKGGYPVNIFLISP